MLTRRKFFKTATALGIGAAFPMNLIGGRSGSAQGGPAQLLSADIVAPVSGLMAIEFLENLSDDLDCLELVAHYASVGRVETLGDYDGYRRARCPFSRGKAHPLLVHREGYHCHDCYTAGTAIEFYLKMEGLSYGEAAPRLRHLLDSGTLQGLRREHKALWAIMADAAELYHRTLIEAPEGAPAREWLERNGITPKTIERFHLGFASTSYQSFLSEHLGSRGYSPEQIETSGLGKPWPYGPEDRPLSRMTMPVRDQQGHPWGLLYHRLEGGWSGWASHGLEGMSRQSPNRFRRLIFPNPMWPQDLGRHKAVFLLQNAWHAVVFSQAGIDNAVFIGTPASMDEEERGYRLRTASGLAPRFIFPFWAEEIAGWEFEYLQRRMGGYFDKVDFLLLPKGHGACDVLRIEGPAAFRERMAKAVPVAQVLRA